MSFRLEDEEATQARIDKRQSEEAQDHDMDYDDFDVGQVDAEVWNLDFGVWNKAKEPPFQRLKDKVAFMLGVVNLTVSAYLLGGFPSYVPIFYSLKYPLLVGSRYFSYKKLSWHYFLADFCYYANFLVLFNLWIFPDSPRLFTVTFCVVNGPLLWAVPLFRNSLVFHSVDKITSCFIHITPAVTVFAARWYLSPSTDFAMTVCKDADCSTSFVDTLGLPVAFFTGHSILYYIFVHIIKRERIKNDPQALTTYKYLVKSNRKSALFKFVSLCGAPYRRVVFTFWYIVFAAIMIAPTYLMYHHFWLNFTALCGACLVAVWNGANFYIEVFSRKYKWKRESNAMPLTDEQAKAVLQKQAKKDAAVANKA